MVLHEVYACHPVREPSRKLAAKVVDSQRLILLAEDPDEVVRKLEMEAQQPRNTTDLADLGHLQAIYGHFWPFSAIVRHVVSFPAFVWR